MKWTSSDGFSGDIELAILIEDYVLFEDEAHVRRMQWFVGENDLKPIVINGRRTNLERTE